MGGIILKRLRRIREYPISNVGRKTYTIHKTLFCIKLVLMRSTERIDMKSDDNIWDTSMNVTFLYGKGP